MATQHTYTQEVIWTGNLGQGTQTYTSYSRNHIIKIKNKPDLYGSADAMFHGESHKYNPEDLFLASLSVCHMLWYLHLCADNKINVLSYCDTPEATLQIEEGGKGRFIAACLHPKVQLADINQKDLAISLHQKANEYCFIANSCTFEIKHKPIITL